MASQPRVVMHTIPGCGYCGAARRLLDRRGVIYDEIPGDSSPRGRARLVKQTGSRTFPQVVVDGESIGGYRQLKRYAHTGGLGAGRPKKTLWGRIRG